MTRLNFISCDIQDKYTTVYYRIYKPQAYNTTKFYMERKSDFLYNEANLKPEIRKEFKKNKALRDKHYSRLRSCSPANILNKDSIPCKAIVIEAFLNSPARFFNQERFQSYLLAEEPLIISQRLWDVFQILTGTCRFEKYLKELLKIKPEFTAYYAYFLACQIKNKALLPLEEYNKALSAGFPSLQTGEARSEEEAIRQFNNKNLILECFANMTKDELGRCFANMTKDELGGCFDGKGESIYVYIYKKIGHLLKSEKNEKLSLNTLTSRNSIYYAFIKMLFKDYKEKLNIY